MIKIWAETQAPFMREKHYEESAHFKNKGIPVDAAQV